MRNSRIRIFLFITLAVLGIAAATQIPFAWRRFYVYPRTRAALDAIARSAAVPAPRRDGLLDLRGVMHAHTYLSHDSSGTPDEIIRAARKTGIDFIFTTDHYGWLTDTNVITSALRGDHQGVFFVAGAEMRDGVMPFFLNRAPTHYDPFASVQQFVNEVRELDAVVFLNHPDDPTRRWDVKGWTGMEIYNLHADAKKSDLSIGWRLGEQVWSIRRYPMEVFHGLFHDPREYLALWDRFTAYRRVVGIAGNDAHQNNGLQLLVGRDGEVMLTDTSGRNRPMMAAYDRISRSLLRLVFGRLEPGRVLWRTDADLYERGFNFVNTHLLARGKTEADLRFAVENGHAYVAFDSLVPARGFDFALYSGDSEAVHAGGAGGQAPLAIMGDEVPFERGQMLVASSPVAAQLRLIQDGQWIRAQTRRSLSYPVRGPGVYRIEALLTVNGRLIPWVYSNPIYIR